MGILTGSPYFLAKHIKDKNMTNYVKGKPVESKQELAEIIAYKKPYYNNEINVFREFGGDDYDRWIADNNGYSPVYYHAEKQANIEILYECIDRHSASVWIFSDYSYWDGKNCEKEGTHCGVDLNKSKTGRSLKINLDTGEIIHE